MPDQRPIDQRSLPDPNICRTQDMASPNLMKCLVDSPEACPFLTQFGGGFYCRHPDRHTFQATGEAKP